VSDHSELCDALIDDLQGNVAGLRDAIVHRYGPWDPEEFRAAAGERHLAVWPAPEVETIEARYIGGHTLKQVYAIAYWEWASDEATRAVLDEDAAKALLDLQNAIRARLYALENANLTGVDRLWYRRTQLPARSSSTRWLVLVVDVDREIQFT